MRVTSFCFVVGAFLIACGSSDGDAPSNPGGGSNDGGANDGSSPSDGGGPGDGGGNPNDGGLDEASQLPQAQGIFTSALSSCTSPEAAGNVASAGTFPNDVVQTGAMSGGHVVTLSCVVSSNGDGFDVDGSMSVAGVGTLHVVATVDATGASTQAVAQLTKAGVARWSSQGPCTLDPTTRPGMGVASGRYWASLHCPGAGDEGIPTCDIVAELRLENCIP